MKISDLLRRGTPIFSCEFFPPKTEEGLAQLQDTILQTKSLNPGFISVTYGAGGSTRGKTLAIVKKTKNELGLESMAHLTCVGHSREELRQILDELRDSGIENIIALRGDPPQGQTQFSPHPDGFSHADELVAFIKKSYPFCIATAGYPEGHVEAPNRETDWTRLAQKVRLGADFIITQLFFDNRDYFHFVEKVRALGVTVPILPGIMPITNWNQILRFTRMCGAKMPDFILRDLAPVQNDAEAVQTHGIEIATRQCEELLARGVPGLHFYTLNKSRSTHAIVQNLRRKKLLP